MNDAADNGHCLRSDEAYSRSDDHSCQGAESNSPTLADIGHCLRSDEDEPDQGLLSGPRRCKLLSNCFAELLVFLEINVVVLLSSWIVTLGKCGK